ncbi:hypothetical protein ABVK25_003495 [Lepraria finkii]|uniref:4a-hydroxytetrahydrobiopterin dehydratase n=1 Tax=Lepraria finkii TaxID=1340010 RepID=A0ABR4BF57_9LECA
MTARAARRFVQSIPRSSNFEHVHNLANFTTSNQTLNNLIMQPKFSEGQDESKVMAELEALVEGGWKLDEEQIGIQRTYHFKTYTKVLDLHHNIGVRSKSKNHHPEMTTNTGSLTVHWTTHYPRGLSAKDTFMAKYCDEQARIIGTVDQSDAQKCGPNPSSQI